MGPEPTNIKKQLMLMNTENLQQELTHSTSKTIVVVLLTRNAKTVRNISSLEKIK